MACRPAPFPPDPGRDPRGARPIVRRRLAAAALLLAFVGLAAGFMAGFGAPAWAEAPRRVLILQSFGPRFAPFDAFVADFRAELARKSPNALDVYEASLETARFAEGSGDAALLDYLHGLFPGGAPDLMVTIGGPAARFVQARRDRLFPETPLLLTGAEVRRVDPGLLTPRDAVALFQIDLPAAAETILATAPRTRRILVVLGASPLERFWRAEAEKAFAPFADRIDFEWTNALAFDEILARVAALPPDSAVLYGLMIVDADGVPFEEARAVAALSAASAAPVFGLYDAQLGAGILGGRLLPTLDFADVAAAAAARLLAGASPAETRLAPVGLGAPRFDDRELRRFGIPEARLPVGSRVEFRAPTAWQLYRWQMVAAGALILVQAAFILGLWASRRRLRLSRAALVESEAQLRQAAEAARDFAGQLIRAQENERSRLARELHDDVTQRLAVLAMEAGRQAMRGGADGAAAGAAAGGLAELREGLARLSQDVHALSYRLHPAILGDLGLAAAVEAECERVSTAEELRIDVEAQDMPKALPEATALCLYRVFQEALRNILRHAQASRAEVRLWTEAGRLRLAVIDDGVGFAPEAPRARPSLGLASIRQRVAAVGGDLRVASAPGRGTRIEVTVPLEDA